MAIPGHLEGADYLSNCSALPSILSFVLFDDVVSCMRVNRTIHTTILRYWEEMPRATADISITSGQQNPAVFFEVKRRTSVFTICVLENKVEIDDKTPPFIRHRLRQHGRLDRYGPRRLRLADGTTAYSCISELKTDSCPSGIHIVLQTVFPRVQLNRLRIWNKLYLCPYPTGFHLQLAAELEEILKEKKSNSIEYFDTRGSAVDLRLMRSLSKLTKNPLKIQTRVVENWEKFPLAISSVSITADPYNSAPVWTIRANIVGLIQKWWAEELDLHVFEISSTLLDGLTWDEICGIAPAGDRENVRRLTRLNFLNQHLIIENTPEKLILTELSF